MEIQHGFFFITNSVHLCLSVAKNKRANIVIFALFALFALKFFDIKSGK